MTHFDPAKVLEDIATVAQDTPVSYGKTETFVTEISELRDTGMPSVTLRSERTKCVFWIKNGVIQGGPGQYSNERLRYWGILRRSGWAHLHSYNVAKSMKSDLYDTSHLE